MVELLKTAAPCYWLLIRDEGGVRMAWRSADGKRQVAEVCGALSLEEAFDCPDEECPVAVHYQTTGFVPDHGCAFTWLATGALPEAGVERVH